MKTINMIKLEKDGQRTSDIERNTSSSLVLRFAKIEELQTCFTIQYLWWLISDILLHKNMSLNDEIFCLFALVSSPRHIEIISFLM